jgi:crotonobetainyl-CoA:carnitine CoA-transferase CaiB-like acyl-CoA transferase
MESTGRMDAMRSNTAKKMTEDLWWEWSPLFQGTNTNKRGVTLDATTPEGLALVERLVTECDVVLDNYTPRVMENFGLTYERLKELRPDLIMVRAPAYGVTGPWRDRGGYAQTIEQVSGLAWLTGYPDETPQVPGGPCDPIAGLHAAMALLLALEHRRRTGEGQMVEVPMIGGAINMAAEAVVEYSAYGNLMERIGNRSVSGAPQGHYLAADVGPEGERDEWVTISIETAAQWSALREALGNPSWAADPKLDSLEGRRAAHNDLDLHLSQWCTTRTADEIVATLWPKGVPVARIVQMHEQDKVEQAATRRAFRKAPHPLWGSSLMQQYPATFSQGPETHYRRAAPMLGEHNRDVLGGLLGLSTTDIDALEAAGHIGNRPTQAHLPF